MTTSFRITFAVIVGLFSLYLINPAIADDAMEADGDATLYVDDNDPSIDDGSMPIDDMTGGDDDMLADDSDDPSIDDDSMPIDDMTGDDDDMLADDSDDPSIDDDSMPIDDMTDDDAALVNDSDDASIDDDSASIDGLTDGDDASALIVSDSGVQAKAVGTHVIGNGTSCKNAASKVVFYLNAKGIPSGHTYIKQGGQVGFRNKDTCTHTITAKPKSLLAYYSKPITVKGSVYTNAAKTQKKISGTFEDNIPAGSPTSHDVTICP